MRWFAGCAAVLLAVLLAGCKHDVYLTNVPLPAEETLAIEGPPTVVYAYVPVESKKLRNALQSMLGGPVERRLRVPGVSCRQVRGQIACRTGSVRALLGPAGPISFSAAADGVLQVEIEYDYTMQWTSRGSNPPVEGKVRARASYALELDGSYQASVTVRPGIVFEPAVLGVGGGKVDPRNAFGKEIESALARAASRLQDAVDGAGVLRQTAKLWRALHTPVDLASNVEAGGSGPWLRGRPSAVENAGFSVEDGATAIRLRFLGAITITDRERPPPLVSVPIPEPRNGADGYQRTRLVYPVTIPFTVLATPLARAFPVGERITTQTASGVGATVSEIIGVRPYGTREQVALEVRMGILQPTSWFPISARFFLTGEPVLDRSRNVIRVERVRFPPRARVQTAPEHTPVAFPLEPFASRFQRAVEVPVVEAIDSAISHRIGRPRHRLANGLLLRGDLTRSVIGSIRVAHDGIVVNVGLEGRLALGQDPANVRQAAAVVKSR
jgi:hypothetical protein